MANYIVIVRNSRRRIRIHPVIATEELRLLQLVTCHRKKFLDKDRLQVLRNVNSGVFGKRCQSLARQDVLTIRVYKCQEVYKIVIFMWSRERNKTLQAKEIGQFRQ